jgi:hypothetical protein
MPLERTPLRPQTRTQPPTWLKILGHFVPAVALAGVALATLGPAIEVERVREHGAEALATVLEVHQPKRSTDYVLLSFTLGVGERVDTADFTVDVPPRVGDVIKIRFDPRVSDGTIVAPEIDLVSDYVHPVGWGCFAVIMAGIGAVSARRAGGR